MIDFSDIDDVDYSVGEENGIDPDYEPPPEPLLRTQWIYLFQNDDDDDFAEGEFRGFQERWKTSKYQ